MALLCPILVMCMNYDSILTAIDSSVIHRTEFYREGVALPDSTVPMDERLYSVGEDSGVVIAMMVAGWVLAVVMYYFRVVFRHRLKDFFTAKRLYVEESVGDNGGEAASVFLLMVTSAFCLSMIFFNGIVEQCGTIPVVDIPYWLYAVGTLVCLCFIYLKAGIYSVVNWVFFDQESASRWMQGYFILTAFTAYFFYPIALIDTYSLSWGKVATGSVILVVIIYELLLFYKLLVNFKAKKNGYLMIFLYFCSVEMLPALVMWHLATLFNGNIIVKNLLY